MDGVEWQGSTQCLWVDVAYESIYKLNITLRGVSCFSFLLPLLSVSDGSDGDRCGGWRGVERVRVSTAPPPKSFTTEEEG